MIGYTHRASNIPPKFWYAWMGTPSLTNYTNNNNGTLQINNTFTTGTKGPYITPYVGSTWLKRGTGGQSSFYTNLFKGSPQGTMEIVWEHQENTTKYIFNIAHVAAPATDLLNSIYSGPGIYDFVKSCDGTSAQPSAATGYGAWYSLVAWIKRSNATYSLNFKHYLISGTTITLRVNRVITTFYPCFDNMDSDSGSAAMSTTAGNWTPEGLNMWKISNKYYLTPSGPSAKPSIQ